MNSVVSFLKTLRLERIIIVFVAGVLLLLNTGCSRPDVQASRPDSGRVLSHESSGQGGTYNQRRGQQTELYDTIQERKGGMNEYSDVDPRVNTRGADAKARALVNNAENNVQKVQNPEEFAEEYRQGKPFGERVQHVVDRVTNATENTANDAAKGTRRGIENLKDNSQTAVDEVSEGARHASQNTSNAAKNQIKRSARGVQEGVENAADALNRDRI